MPLRVSRSRTAARSRDAPGTYNTATPAAADASSLMRTAVEPGLGGAPVTISLPSTFPFGWRRHESAMAIRVHFYAHDIAVLAVNQPPVRMAMSAEIELDARED